MSIPKRFLDELRGRLTLSDMISRRVKVTRAGREYKACCPFHKENTPSFTINDDKQFYHCFGCGAHGDVINFFMQHDNMSFIDTVEMLAGEAGMQVPQASPEEIARAKKAKDLFALMNDACLYFENALADSANKDVQTYLAERGLKPETLAGFRVGYAPADRQALREHLSTKGYSDSDMIEAGLLKPSNKGGDPYVFFRDRVMFPVTDRRGRVVAFGGRTLPEHLRPIGPDGFKPPKYINSPDTPLFDKGRVLYGESQARQASSDGHTLIVTEGYMDVIACHQAGFKGAVAPMGTALTEEQIILLWGMIPADERNPVLCFDGDNAGRRAAERSAERVLPLLKANHSVRLAFLPEGEDPDSLIRHGGAQGLRRILESAMSLFDFIWSSHTAGRAFKTPEARAGLVKALENQVRSIADSEVQKHYFSLVRRRTGDLFYQRRDNNRVGKGKYSPAPAPLKPRAPVFRDRYARALLAGVVNYPTIYDKVGESFGEILVEDARLNQMRQNIIVALEENENLDRGALIDHLKAAGFSQEVDDILNESVYRHAAFVAPGREQPLEVADLWLELWLDIQGQGMKREMRAGWKSAFYNASEDEEEKLRQMTHAGAAGQDQT